MEQFKVIQGPMEEFENALNEFNARGDIKITDIQYTMQRVTRTASHINKPLHAALITYKKYAIDNNVD
jgi:hypothetical protein